MNSIFCAHTYNCWYIILIIFIFLSGLHPCKYWPTAVKAETKTKKLYFKLILCIYSGQLHNNNSLILIFCAHIIQVHAWLHDFLYFSSFFLYFLSVLHLYKCSFVVLTTEIREKILYFKIKCYMFILSTCSIITICSYCWGLKSE